jgi:hypothetical protein
LERESLQNSTQLKITVSFRKKDKEVYDYLKGIGNASDFICRAVREKMNNEPANIDIGLEAKIRNIIDEYLSERGVLLGQNENKNPHSHKNINNNDDESLTDVLNIFEF